MLCALLLFAFSISSTMAQYHEPAGVRASFLSTCLVFAFYALFFLTLFFLLFDSAFWFFVSFHFHFHFRYEVPFSFSVRFSCFNFHFHFRSPLTFSFRLSCFDFHFHIHFRYVRVRPLSFSLLFFSRCSTFFCAGTRGPKEGAERSRTSGPPPLPERHARGHPSRGNPPPFGDDQDRCFSKRYLCWSWQSHHMAVEPSYGSCALVAMKGYVSSPSGGNAAVYW